VSEVDALQMQANRKRRPRQDRSVQAIVHFASNIWFARSASVRFVGVRLPTRAIIARLADGSVWINSPVETSEEVNREITSIGPIHSLVAPNSYHVWRLEAVRARYPGAQLWMPPKYRGQFNR